MTELNRRLVLGVLLILVLALPVFATTLSDVEDDFSDALFFEDDYLIEMLIEDGLDLNAWDEELKETAFLFAIRERAEDFLIEFLVEQGAELEIEEGPPAIVYAAMWNRDGDITRTLIELGADVNATDDEGYTALMRAVRHDYKISIVEALIEAEVDLEIKDEFWGDNALMLAARYNEKPDIIEALVAAGADINAVNHEGWSPLMFAVWFNDDNPEIIKLLLDLGADPLIILKTSLTAYELAEDNGLDDEILELLKIE